MKELRFHGQSIVTGRGSIDYLAQVEGSRFFIVTGQTAMFKAGVISTIEALLTAKGRAVQVYSGVPKNPSVGLVQDGLAVMHEFKPDVVVGVGGGSAIDSAKIMSLCYEYPEFSMESLKTSVPEQRRTVKLIAIPSTSGTAAEVTRTAVITFPDEQIKIGLKSPGLIPDVAILDANLTLSMPPNVVAETGMDAMSHAVECFLNNNVDDFTDSMAAGAIEGLYKYLPESYLTGSIEAREKVHNYQCLAGCAFANVGTGMNHGIAHAFGGVLNYTHGLLIAVALPYVLKFNCISTAITERLDYLAKRIGEHDFIEAVIKLNRTLNIPNSFAQMGLSEQEFQQQFEILADNSMKGSTARNPVHVSRDAMETILKEIYYGH